MSAGRSKPSSSGSMLTLSGVYNPANITFIFHYTPPVVDPPSIPTSTVPMTIEVLTSAPSAPRHGEVLRRYTGAGENPGGFRKRGWGQTKQRFLAPKSEKTIEICGCFCFFKDFWGFPPGKSSKASNKRDWGELFLQQVDSPTAKRINEGPLIGENLGANSERELLEGSSHLVSA